MKGKDSKPFERWSRVSSTVVTKGEGERGVTAAPLPAAPAAQRRVQKNQTTALPVYEEAHRLLGVDLSSVPGVSGGVLCVLMSELGTATHIRAKLRSAEAFASWLGLCPTTGSPAGRYTA